MTQARLRAEVLAFVERYPGVHARELERQMGLTNRAGAYHLDALEREGALARVETGGYVRFFPRETRKRLTPRDLAFVCLLRHPPALQIVLLLLSKGELTPGAMSERLALARPSVSYHIKALLEADVLDVQVEGRERHYSLRDRAYVARALASFHPLPGDLDAFSSLWNDLIGR
jgi:predicted transcriptional regulator